jgi:cobalamin biosynthesis Mg chelatase CobN
MIGPPVDKSTTCRFAGDSEGRTSQGRNPAKSVWARRLSCVLQTRRRVARVVVYTPTSARVSQRSVERLIGKLVTDEAFRRRFAEDSEAALREMAQDGLELNHCERHALKSLDAEVLEDLARAIDPRLQKTDIEGGIH